MQCMHVLISSYVFLQINSSEDENKLWQMHRNTEAVPCTMKNNENTCCNTAVILTAFCYALEKVFFFPRCDLKSHNYYRQFFLK